NPGATSRSGPAPNTVYAMSIPSLVRAYRMSPGVVTTGPRLGDREVSALVSYRLGVLHPSTASRFLVSPPSFFRKGKPRVFAILHGQRGPRRPLAPSALRRGPHGPQRWSKSLPRGFCKLAPGHRA